MKHTKLALAIFALGCGFSTLALANGYYSSETPQDNSGYFSSQTPPSTQGGYEQTVSVSASRTVVQGDNPETTMIYTSRQAREKHNSGLYWTQPKHNRLPKNAVIGGHENNGKSLYICQAPFHGGVHPGKVVGYNCNIGYAGREILTPGFQVLASSGYYSWTSADNGEIPDYAFPGGYEKGRPLYICQARYAGGVHPGKVVGASCNITFGGKEVTVSRYNVLVTR